MTCIGILGAGQLARMLALAGYPLGLSFCFYDTNENVCAAPIGKLVVGAWDDKEKLQAFAKQVDIITYENENIPVDCIEFLQQLKPVYPGIKPLSISQDRFLEKSYIQDLGIPVAPFQAFQDRAGLENIAEQIGFPFIIKTRRLGYDGKGQFRINHAKDLAHFALPTNEHGWIAEKFIRFEREVSLIAARNTHGEMKFYDICENGHDQGILRQTRNNIDDPLFDIAKQHLIKLFESFEYVGVLTAEYFVSGGELIVNEIAPRVHNSGHWTIDGAKTSQFENHLRAILGWSLGDTESIGQVIMTNFIGQMPAIESLMGHSDIHVHSYAKEARPGRKIGHMTKIIR